MNLNTWYTIKNQEEWDTYLNSFKEPIYRHLFEYDSSVNFKKGYTTISKYPFMVYSILDQSTDYNFVTHTMLFPENLSEAMIQSYVSDIADKELL